MSTRMGPGVPRFAEDTKTPSSERICELCHRPLYRTKAGGWRHHNGEGVKCDHELRARLQEYRKANPAGGGQ